MKASLARIVAHHAQGVDDWGFLYIQGSLEVGAPFDPSNLQLMAAPLPLRSQINAMTISEIRPVLPEPAVGIHRRLREVVGPALEIHLQVEINPP